MADKAKSIADRIAGLFNQSEDPEPVQEAPDSPPAPKQKAAKAFEKGATGEVKPDYMKNLKDGLGLGN